MTTTKLVDNAKFFSIGDVLVYETTHSNAVYRGAKVIDYAWVTVDGTETKFYAIQSGKTQDNKFVTEGGVVTFVNVKSLAEYGFDLKWTPTPAPKFNAGDVLKGQGDTLFFFESEDQVWKLDGTQYYGAQWTTLENRVVEFGPLTVWKTAGNNPFSNVIRRVFNES